MSEQLLVDTELLYTCNNTIMAERKKLTIFYDGQCTMCSSLIETISTSEKQEHFLPKDMHTSVLPKNVTLKDINKEIYVTDSNGVMYKNADAILKISEEYFNVKHLTTIGRLPGIRQMLTIGYNFIAANRHLLTGKIRLLFWLKLTIVIAFLASLLISTKLWLTERLYPLIPVFTEFPHIGSPFDYLIFVGLLILLFSTAIVPRPKKYIWILIGTFLFLILGDQSRLHPWVVQYIFMLGILSLFSWDRTDKVGTNTTLTVLRIIVAFTYFYSGLQKLNIGFMGGVMPWILEPATNLIPSLMYYVPLIAFVAPFIQIFFAIGLLTQRYRRTSLILAVSMHLFIIAMIGPFGHNWNSTVWPWTIAMAVFDIILFSTKDSFTFKETLFSRLSLAKSTVILFFVIAPLLSFYNKWDSYLSSALYSGNVTSGTIFMNKDTKNTLPEKLQEYFEPKGATSTYYLNISMWSIQELNSPSYPETRIYKHVTKKICELTHNDTSVTLHIQEQRLFNAMHDKRYMCNEL